MLIMRLSLVLVLTILQRTVNMSRKIKLRLTIEKILPEIMLQLASSNGLPLRILTKAKRKV